ncbi:MAG: hypothetical protein EPN91_12045 [Salinibacterium sp.]|nr:MAG: hypothetical protein EPN91_12045 [Salinibacterium sp.]
METVIIRRGSGYSDCTAFNGFTVIASPLPNRDDRVFGNVTYASHAVQLAADEYGDLFVLLQHGGGRLVVRFRPPSDGGATKEALIAMPERVLYAVLYALVTTAERADAVARRETQAEWAQAYCDGRIKKSRAKQGSRRVEIIPAAGVASLPLHA